MHINIIQRGMQLSGDVNSERLFDEVQKFAVISRYSPDQYPEISTGPSGLQLHYTERNTGIDIELPVDAIVLATPYRSIEKTKELAMQLKVPVTHDGFFLEAHVKLRPVDFATEGIFLAGGAQWPKSLEDSVMQGLAASSRVTGLLSKGYVEVEGITANVDEEICIGCGKCEEVCPYKAIEMNTVERVIDNERVLLQKAHVIEAMCKGCGTCVATCPSHAIDQKHFKTKQISGMIKALFPAPGERCCL
jgi:heterodisulfide reductase subunit A